MPRWPLVSTLFLSVSAAVSAQTYSMQTIAGTDRLLDNQKANTVPLRSPYGIAADANGNFYIADSLDNRVRKVSANGVITTLAGNGLPGYSGDRGPASQARLNSPVDVALDAAGNVYIADRGNALVRRVSPDGTINTVAGTGNSRYGGDNGPALRAQLDPTALAFDSHGNLYIGDGDNFRVRKVDTNQIITTFAGNGQPGNTGDNGPATSAAIHFVSGIAIDPNGVVYLATFLWVRKVDSSAMITTIAGSGPLGYILDGIPATQAVLVPSAVALDKTNGILIADINRSQIRRVDLTTNLIGTIAGNGGQGFTGDGGSALQAELNLPLALAIDSNNEILIGDTGNARIRKIANGTISTAAGTSIGDGAAAAAAFLNFPAGIAVDGKSNIVIADTYDGEVRKFTVGGAIGSFGQIPLGQTAFGASVDAGGNFYVTDDEPRVLKIAPSGTTTVVAGNGKTTYGGDGVSATSTGTGQPTAVAADSAGNIYFADYAASQIRMVSANGRIKTIAGNGNAVASGDNGPALSAGMDPYDIALDAQGNVYIADFVNNRIRKIAPNQTITTIAGTGKSGHTGDGGLATSATLSRPAGVAVDGAGNLYVADTGNSVVRRITASGLITTIAGSGIPYPSTIDNGPAISAQMNPARIAVDASNNVYVTDLLNDRVRKLTPVGAVPASLTVIGGNNQQGSPGAALGTPLVVKLTDRNGAGVPGVELTYTVSPAGAATTTPAITLNDGTASTNVVLGSTPGNVTVTVGVSGISSVAFTLTIISPTAPLISAGGITSAGLSVPAITALSTNAIASIFGTQFAAPGTALKVGPGDLVNGAIPTNFNGVCVQFGSVRAPVFEIFQNQVTIQVPAVGAGSVNVTVITQCDTTNAQTSNAISVQIQNASPEFFYFIQNANGRNPIAAIDAVTGSYIGAPNLISGATFTPATSGEYLTLFATGFGPTNPAFAPGQIPNVAANVTSDVSVVFGGVTLAASDILYAGATSNAGLYQLSIRVPAGVPSGDQALIITVGGVASSPGGYVTVQ